MRQTKTVDVLQFQLAEADFQRRAWRAWAKKLASILLLHTQDGQEMTEPWLVEKATEGVLEEFRLWEERMDD